LNDLAPTQARALGLRDLQMGRLSVDFLVCQIATRVAGLALTDGLLVMAINQANIAPLTRDPAARSLYGSLEAPAPDQLRRPVSVSAVASSLGLPFETVRRRVRALQAAGVCESAAGGVIVPETFLTSPEYLTSVAAAHGQLRAMFLAAEAAGLIDELPPSRFDVAQGVPVRSAARLVSDYILRTAEQLMHVTDDLTSAVCLLGVLQASLSPAPRRAPGLSAAGLARTLGAAPETARRHAQQLVDRGLCARGPEGLVVTDEMLSAPAMAAFLRANAVNVQRLFAGLAERGVIDAWRGR